jgi:hypothetical protein
MKKYIFIFLVIAFMEAPSSFSQEFPKPLKGIEVKGSIEHRTRYEYSYSIFNPASNDGGIKSMDIFLGTDSTKDQRLSTEGYSHCSLYMKAISEDYLEKDFPVPVGSRAPDKWSCGYGKLPESSEISYGWGALDQSVIVQAGQTKKGFQLTSEGLPGIRDVRVEPELNLAFGPDGEEPDMSLFSKVIWTGKTIGPKAPPKNFDPTKFIQYIESLLDESSKLGWVKNRGTENSLNKQLIAAERQIGKNGNHPTKKMMEAFLKEVKNLKKKHLSSEAYALLYYNTQYFLDHLEVEKDHKDCGSHKGHNKGHKHP